MPLSPRCGSLLINGVLENAKILDGTSIFYHTSQAVLAPQRIPSLSLHPFFYYHRLIFPWVYTADQHKNESPAPMFPCMTCSYFLIMYYPHKKGIVPPLLILKAKPVKASQLQMDFGFFF